MQNQLVVDPAESPIEAASPAIRVHIRFARYVSTILAPATISGPLVIAVALYHVHNLLNTFIYAGITLLFLSLGPLAYILLGVRLGKLSDVDVSRRSERTGPFLFSIASMVIGLCILMYLHGPKNLETVLLGTAGTSIILMVTTWWWKISIHAASLAGGVTMLTALYGPVALPAFLLLVLVCWSRVALRRHTVAQVVAGSLVSVVLTLLIVLLRGV